MDMVQAVILGLMQGMGEFRHFLLRYLQPGTFLPFVIYRFALGALVLGVSCYRWAA